MPGRRRAGCGWGDGLAGGYRERTASGLPDSRGTGKGRAPGDERVPRAGPGRPDDGPAGGAAVAPAEPRARGADRTTRRAADAGAAAAGDAGTGGWRLSSIQ